MLSMGIMPVSIPPPSNLSCHGHSHESSRPQICPLQAEPGALGLKVTDVGVPLWLRASWHFLCLSFPTRLWEIPVLRGQSVPPSRVVQAGDNPPMVCVSPVGVPGPFPSSQMPSSQCVSQSCWVSLVLVCVPSVAPHT